MISFGGDGEPTLEGPALAGTSPNIYDTQAVLNAGLADGETGKLLKTLGEHQYQGAYSAASNLASGNLMGKANIRANMTKNAKEVTRARAYGLPYILGETNSYAK